MIMNKSFNWKDFEETAKSVIDLICSDKVVFVCSGNKCILSSQYGDNQFDVLYKWNSSIKTSFIAIECKYWNTLVDKDEIRNFNQKCIDCKIDTKIIVSKAGFTNRAILEATGKNIELIELRNFTEQDFKDCFKNKILEINMNLIIHTPEYNCVINADIEKSEEVILGLDHNFTKLVYNEKEELLTNHIPFGNISDKILKEKGFEKINSEIAETKTITTYRKKIDCNVIKIDEKITKIKNLNITIKEIVDTKNAITQNININFREEIKKAGYLIAKKIVEKSNFVLDLKNKNIIDQN